MTRRTSSCTRYKGAVTVAKDHELRQALYLNNAEACHENATLS